MPQNILADKVLTPLLLLVVHFDLLLQYYLLTILFLFLDINKKAQKNKLKTKRISINFLWKLMYV